MANYEGLLGFMEVFGTEDACKSHLASLKWSNGYQCRKCNHSVSVKGATRHHRRCQRCKYDESCTANTLFHKVKFPLSKAFTIVYLLSTMKKGLASTEIARQFGIHQETAWFFKQKVMRAMASTQGSLLDGVVEVDETSIGGFEPGKPGRSHGKKSKVEVAVEVIYPEHQGKAKLKQAKALIIKDYTAKSLGKAIDQMVSKKAFVVTDGLAAYIKAVGPRELVQGLSNKGENFKELHWYIFNLKNWLRGIHHKVSKGHLQAYLEEFNFRFNNRNLLQSCPKTLLKTFVLLPWLPYSRLIAG